MTLPQDRFPQIPEQIGGIGELAAGLHGKRAGTIP